ncbi:MAG: class I SAM-dependent methyltransferase [Anaerolineaceae bacterium]|nr:class I SAM-dependent methyltransferase [Anaerolineaceae bacterium]
MAGDYAVLAPVYEEIGLAKFARNIAPDLIHFVQSHTDWLGRRVLDLGSGMGETIQALADYNFAFVAVESSPDMLNAAQTRLSDTGLNVKWSQQDIRQLDPTTGLVDLALALDIINDLNSLRDLEAVFKGVHHLLDTGKLFIFDLYTLQGLAEFGREGEHMVYNQPDKLTVFASNQYDYERQMHTQEFIIFRHEGGGWQRTEASRILRTFPVQAVASLVQRSGFEITMVLDTHLNVFQPGATQVPRVIFIAKKQ